MVCETPEKKVKVVLRRAIDPEIPNLPLDIDSFVEENFGVKYETFEIPTVDVETSVTNDGVASLNRTTIVKFPMVWNDNNYFKEIKAIQSKFYVEADVFFRENEDSDYKNKHSGYVGGVGGGDGVGTLYVRDKANILDNIYAHRTFKRLKARDYLDYVAKKTRESSRLSPFNTNVNNAPQSREGVEVPDNERFNNDRLVYIEDETVRKKSGIPESVNAFNVAIDAVGNLVDFGSSVLTGGDGEDVATLTDPVTEKSFTSNKHSLADVMNYYAKMSESIWYFAPDGTLTVDRNPNKARIGFRDRNLSAENDRFNKRTVFDVDVLENDALSQISPVDSLVVRGKSQGLHVNDMLAKNPSYTRSGNEVSRVEYYPVGVAYNPVLLPENDTEKSVFNAIRSGDLGNSAVVNTDAISVSEARKQAKERLRKHYREGAGRGKIVLKGEPRITPQDQITALSTVCVDFRDTKGVKKKDFILTYDVKTVRNRQREAGFYKTELTATVATSRNGVLSEGNLVNAKSKEVIPGKVNG